MLHIYSPSSGLVPCEVGLCFSFCTCGNGDTESVSDLPRVAQHGEWWGREGNSGSLMPNSVLQLFPLSLPRWFSPKPRHLLRQWRFWLQNPLEILVGPAHTSSPTTEHIPIVFLWTSFSDVQPRDTTWPKKAPTISTLLSVPRDAMLRPGRWATRATVAFPTSFRFLMDTWS